MSNSNSNLLANMGDSPISDPVLLYRNELLQGLKEIIGDEKDLIGESIANIHGVLANTRSELLANSAIENLQAILPTSNDGFIQAKFEISVNNNNAQLLPPPMLLSASARSRLRTAAIAQAQDELKPLHVIIDVLKNISKQLNDALDNDNAATIVALLKNLTVIRETYENYLTTLTDSHLLEKSFTGNKSSILPPRAGTLLNQSRTR
ncbi:MAG: hypothetical protein HWD59_02215 [Coxiellaceae bacterium]|nr:MAG: hypothetical protein HWD59_02215 [Coxiellaceae bacterium]